MRRARARSPRLSPALLARPGGRARRKSRLKAPAGGPECACAGRHRPGPGFRAGSGGGRGKGGAGTPQSASGTPRSPPGPAQAPRSPPGPVPGASPRGRAGGAGPPRGAPGAVTGLWGRQGPVGARLCLRVRPGLAQRPAGCLSPGWVGVRGSGSCAVTCVPRSFSFAVSAGS